jgi:plastocyanin
MDTAQTVRSRAFLAATLAATLGMAWLPAGMPAADEAARTVRISVGDYAFRPDEIRVKAGRPLVLELVNIDGITPHNFTLEDARAGLDIDVSLAPRETKPVRFVPTRAGRYVFYCNKKLPFLKSHRARGMEGVLIVEP